MNVPQYAVDLHHEVSTPTAATSEFLEAFSEELAALERTVPLSQQQQLNCFSPRPLVEGAGSGITAGKITTEKAGSPDDLEFSTKQGETTPQATTQQHNMTTTMHYPQFLSNAANSGVAGHQDQQLQSSRSPGPLTMNTADALLPDELSEFFASYDGGVGSVGAARRSSLAPLMTALEQQELVGGGPGLQMTADQARLGGSRRSSLDLLAAMTTGGGLNSRSSSLAPLLQDASSSSFIPQTAQEPPLPAAAAAATPDAANGGVAHYGAENVTAKGKRKLDENGHECYVMPLNDVDQQEQQQQPPSSSEQASSLRKAKRRRSSMSMKAAILRRMSGFSTGSVGPLDQFDWAASSVPGDDAASAAAALAAQRRSSMGMGAGAGMLRRLSSAGTLASSAWFDDGAAAEGAPRPPGPGDAAAGVGVGFERRGSMGSLGALAAAVECADMADRRGSMGSLGPLSVVGMGVGGAAAERRGSMGSLGPLSVLMGGGAAERRGSMASMGSLGALEEFYRRSSLDHIGGAIGPSAKGAASRVHPAPALPPFTTTADADAADANVVTPSLDQLERAAGQQWQPKEGEAKTNYHRPSGARRVSVASTSSSTSAGSNNAGIGARPSSAASAMSSAAATAATSVSEAQHTRPLEDLKNARTRASAPQVDVSTAATKMVVAMERSKKSQTMLHNWDKKMGLKKSHSKTMRMSRTSREKLLDAVGMQLLMAGGGIAAEMARASAGARI